MNGARRPRARTGSKRRRRIRVAQLLPASNLLINNSSRPRVLRIRSRRTSPIRMSNGSEIAIILFILMHENVTSVFKIRHVRCCEVDISPRLQII